MMVNFVNLKKQLKDLSAIINTFKSEAVQLKIIDFLFQGFPFEVSQKAEEPEKVEVVVEPKKRRGRRRKAVEAVPAPVVEAAPEVVEMQQPVEQVVEKEEPVVEVKPAEVVVAPKKSSGKKVVEKKPKPVKSSGEPRKVQKVSGRPGPTTILNTLLMDGFFNTRKTIGDIVKHCQQNLTINYKSTDLSGALAKLVTDSKLMREKNVANNTFEYISK